MEPFSLRKYSHIHSEKTSLQKLLTLSDSDEIWQFDKLVVTLTNVNSALFYLVDNQIDQWCGFILTQGRYNPCDILLVFVAPQYRGQGMGSKLLQFALSEMSNNFSEFILEVSRNNASAIRLYEKAGFNQIDIRKSYYRDGSDAMIYKKVIDELDEKEFQEKQAICTSLLFRCILGCWKQTSLN